MQRQQRGRMLRTTALVSGLLLSAWCPSATATPRSTEGLVVNDSDNDGLWTSMYGAGECFAYGATRDPAARQRAWQVFEALRFLSIAPRDGSHPAPEFPEQNPFFNLCYAVFGIGQEHTDPWSTSSLASEASWLDESVATLRRFPLDRFNWAHDNAGRLDLVRVPGDGIDVRDRYLRTTGRVIPVDERHFNHWNHNPWRPNSGGDGRTLASGTVYLLPYWMARYRSFLSGSSE